MSLQRQNDCNADELVPQEESQSPKSNLRGSPGVRFAELGPASRANVTLPLRGSPHSGSRPLAMTSRTRFLITAALVCHLLLAPSVVTSQLLFASGTAGRTIFAAVRAFLGERAGRHHPCPAAGKGRRRVQAARTGGDPLWHVHSLCRFSRLQLRHRRGDRGRPRGARRRTQ